MTATGISSEGTIRRTGGIALWRQIADFLRAELRADAWPAGTALPTEASFAERFGVNRHTVRRAIAELEAEGLLRSDQGRGTFAIGRRLAYPIGRRTRFSEIVGRQAKEPAGRLVGSGIEPAGPWQAEALDVAEATPLVCLETLGVADGVPLSLARSWFVAARFPDIADTYAETGSITAALARHGVDDYVRRWTRVRARTAEPGECRRLNLEPGASILITEALNDDAAGNPLHVSSTRFAAERIEIVVETPG
ncbi:MAG: phosphonate metabolism transcriptional regulator PhnF [Bauldia sp.]|nr:phosphonate metabolism transcriptional regulator PhnF [Bauldia sp.]